MQIGHQVWQVKETRETINNLNTQATTSQQKNPRGSQARQQDSPLPHDLQSINLHLEDDDDQTSYNSDNSMESNESVEIDPRRLAKIYKNKYKKYKVYLKQEFKRNAAKDIQIKKLHPRADRSPTESIILVVEEAQLDNFGHFHE